MIKKTELLLREKKMFSEMSWSWNRGVDGASVNGFANRDADCGRDIVAAAIDDDVVASAGLCSSRRHHRRALEADLRQTDVASVDAPALHLSLGRPLVRRPCI